MGGNPQRGFSLIELTIVIALAGLLVALAMPSITTFIVNARIRNAAESTLNGLQLTRAEAVRRNAAVTLQIAADGMSWNVIADGATVQTHNAGGNTNACIYDASWNCLTLPLPVTSITYNGMGRMIAPATSFAQLVGSANQNNRTMCTAVIGNTPRLCDPRRLDNTDPQGCFAFDGAAVTRIPGCPCPPAIAGCS
jgi:type IV fimbrial biogenesis protein FimT